MSASRNSCDRCERILTGDVFKSDCSHRACPGPRFCSRCFPAQAKEKTAGGRGVKPSQITSQALKKPKEAVYGTRCIKPGCSGWLKNSKRVTLLEVVPEVAPEPVAGVDAGPAQQEEGGNETADSAGDGGADAGAAGGGDAPKVNEGAAPVRMPVIDWTNVVVKMYGADDVPIHKRPQVCGHMVGKGRDTLCFDCDKADGDGRPRSPGSKLPDGYRAHRKRGGLVGTMMFLEPIAPTQDLPPAEALGDGWGDAISIGGEDDGADGVNVLPFAELNLGGGPQNVHQPDAAALQAAFNPAAGGLPPQMAAPNEADDRMLALCLASAAAAPIMQLRHEFGGNSPHRELVIEWFSNFMSSAPQQL